MTEKEALAAQLAGMIQKAKRVLESGGVLLEDGDYEGASSKAYYAVFHMPQAALLTKSLSFSRHAGVGWCR